MGIFGLFSKKRKSHFKTKENHHIPPVYETTENVLYFVRFLIRVSLTKFKQYLFARNSHTQIAIKKISFVGNKFIHNQSSNRIFKQKLLTETSVTRISPFSVFVRNDSYVFFVNVLS